MMGHQGRATLGDSDSKTEVRVTLDNKRKAKSSNGNWSLGSRDPTQDKSCQPSTCQISPSLRPSRSCLRNPQPSMTIDNNRLSANPRSAGGLKKEYEQL